MARIARLIGGGLLIILGFAGLFLPILQGWLFLLLGILLLSVDLPVAKRVVCWIENSFPRLSKILQRARSFLKRDTKC